MSKFPTVISANELTDMFAGSQVQQTNQSAGVAFLKMDFETGEWLLGRDAEDVTQAEIHVNSPSIKHGWILWSGGRPTKNMVAVDKPIPMPMAGVGGDEPAEARSFEGSLVDDLTPLQFDTASYGGRKGVDALLAAIIQKSSVEKSQFIFPKVSLESESYASTQRGGKLIYNPVFKVVAWYDGEGNEEAEKAPAVEDKTGEVDIDNKPKRQRRKD